MPRPAAARLPPVLLLHGTADKSVPMEIAVEFAAALQVRGCREQARRLVQVRCQAAACWWRRHQRLPLAPSPCAAQEAGARVALKLYKGKTHTQPIVEDPMRGGRDVLMDDVLSMVGGVRVFLGYVAGCWHCS